jgi:uncharacterized protein YgiM (DUF1202 family)
MLKGDYNVLNAKVKHEQETLYTIKGKWDNRLDITVISFAIIANFAERAN